MNKIHRKEFKKLLPVELSEQEIREAASKMADAVISLRETEKAKKASNADFKDTMDFDRGVMTENAELVEKGSRFEEIDCEQIFDFEAKTSTIRRMDTKEDVEVRDMTEDELQMEFGDQGEEEEEETEEPAVA